MQIKIVTSMDEELVERQVNEWVLDHPELEVIRLHFALTAGSNFSYAGCCIEYKKREVGA